MVGQHRSTQRRQPTPRSDQANLTQAVITLAEKFGRYGYQRITALLNREGWRVSVGRVYRIWDELGEPIVRHGPPEHIRSVNGPEFIAKALRELLGRMGTVRASTVNFETSYWRPRPSMICMKPKRSSETGGPTTTPKGLTLRLATSRQLNRASCPLRSFRPIDGSWHDAARNRSRS